MIALAAALLAVSPDASNTCRDGATADEAVTAVYDLVSVPADGSWDWARIGALFVDEAMFVTVMPHEGASIIAKADLPARHR